MKRLKRFGAFLLRTPLHPQWLLGPQVPPSSLEQRADGIYLDVGAGDRWMRRHLPESCAYVALDYPITALEYGSRPDVYADAAKLPFADSSFDGVFCLEVLEHVPHPAEVVQEIARVLRPGGKAWVSMPFLYPLHDAPRDFQRYTGHGLERDFELAGLRVVRAARKPHAVRTAGLLACLAIAGGPLERGGWALTLLPIAALVVLAINLVAFILSLVWPDWHAISAGHEFEAYKP